MIIIDENVEEYWINLISQNGYPFISIRNSHSGISDIDVINIAKEHRGIILPEDKDFGELVFAYGYSGLSIILLRYDQPIYQQIEIPLLKCIKTYFSNNNQVFITISKNKTRICEI